MVTGSKADLFKVDTRHECVGIGCRSWYCNDCMVGKALALRADLSKAVETFSGVFMLTLTIDPKIFKDPERELAYVQKKRCVAKLVAKLRDNPRCKLYTDRFFCIREFHADGRVHYHVLMDAKFIPFEEVRDAWGEFEPKTYQRLAGDNSPRFGSVRFTKKPFADRLHAARYVTKYLTKTPDEGFPEWVLKRRNRLQRYTVSHHFWQSCGVDRGRKDPCPACTEEVKRDEVSTCDPECFCDKCVGEAAPSLVAMREADPTIEQRVSKCCSTSAILALEEWCREDGEIYTRRKFLGHVEQSPSEIADQFDVTVGGRKKRFTLRANEVNELLGDDCADDNEPDEPDQYARWFERLDRGLDRPENWQHERDRRHAWGRRF
ncbi:rolling circle replication-associated protein [Botrimarina mediterranea]|uniref:rolling circle replication-associated protein n=1 Tax=Botrimarina mediterranea TaxID=2528022 RepID=UPI00118CBD37|nr:hypothetical protein K2D_12880 [Planctomycetes bacterium K2D]